MFNLQRTMKLEPFVKEVTDNAENIVTDNSVLNLKKINL